MMMRSTRFHCIASGTGSQCYTSDDTASTPQPISTLSALQQCARYLAKATRCPCNGLRYKTSSCCQCLHSHDSKKCAGHPFEFCDPFGPMNPKIVLQHKERDYFRRPDRTLQISQENNRYYPCQAGCILPRHPHFNAALVRIHPDLIIDGLERVTLANNSHV